MKDYESRSNVMKKHMYMVILLLTAFILTGCSGSDNKDSISLEENQIWVYCLNSSKTGLAKEAYTLADTDDVDSMLDELFFAMSKPSDTKSHKSAITQYAVVQNRMVEDKVLSVYFSEDYYNMTSIEEIMFRAAYVKTMTQLPEVEYVSFFVNEQALSDAMGKETGLMTGTDFVEDTGGSINTMQWIDLDVYYANATGERLEAEKIRVGYGKNASIEKVVIEQLLNGPGDDAHTPTIPGTVKLLSVVTEDGVCYVDFDSSFAYSVTTALPEVTIYSIVNSLCQLPEVSRVKISINGEDNLVYRAVVDLSGLLEPDMELIENNN